MHCIPSLLKSYKRFVTVIIHSPPPEVKNIGLSRSAMPGLTPVTPNVVGSRMPKPKFKEA